MLTEFIEPAEKSVPQLSEEGRSAHQARRHPKCFSMGDRHFCTQNDNSNTDLRKVMAMNWDGGEEPIVADAPENEDEDDDDGDGE